MKLSIKKNLTNQFLLLSIFLSLVLVLSVSIFYGDFSSFITFSVCILLNYLFFNKLKGGFGRKLQMISFTVNVSFAVLITFSFEYLYGTWYSSGQDDFTFYTIANHISKDDYIFHVGTGYLEWGSIQYKLYVLVFGYWFKMLNAIGIDGNFFFHLNIVNSYVASFIAPFVYKIGMKLFGNKSVTPKKAALVCLLFPPLIYYSSVIIRDSWIISLFLIITYLLLSDTKILKKIVLISVLTVFIFYLRKSSAVFVVAFILLYISFNIKNYYFLFFINKIVPVVVLLIIIVFFVAIQLPTPRVSPPQTDILNYINYTVNFYRKLSVGESVESSLGLRLRLSNNPIVLFIYYIYFYLSPIPPSFVKNFNIINFFLGIGNILWYVLSPLYFIQSFQLRKTNRKVFVKTFFWFLMLVLVMVGTATGEQRHLLFLYPIVLLFSTNYILNHKQQFYKYLIYFFFLSLFCALIYILLKIII